jgi:hypothetical protein
MLTSISLKKLAWYTVYSSRVVGGTKAVGAEAASIFKILPEAKVASTWCGSATLENTECQTNSLDKCSRRQ